MTIETFDQSDEDTWPGQKNNDKDNNKYKDHDKDMTWLVSLCEIVDNTDSWEPEFMTIIVTWQLKVTLDSIHNSCNISTTKTQIGGE